MCVRARVRVHIHRPGKRLVIDVPAELEACMLSLVSRGSLLVCHSEKQVLAPPSGKLCVRPEMKPLIIPRLLEGGEWHMCARRVCVFVPFQARRALDGGLCNAAAHVQSFPAHSVDVFSSSEVSAQSAAASVHRSSAALESRGAAGAFSGTEASVGASLTRHNTPARPGDTIKTMKTVATGSSLRNQPSVCHTQTC